MELRRDCYRFRFPEIARTLRHPFSVAASITIPLAVSNAGLFRGLGRMAGGCGGGGGVRVGRFVGNFSMTLSDTL